MGKSSKNTDYDLDQSLSVLSQDEVRNAGIIYKRVSTPRQSEQGSSLDDQEESLKEEAEKRDIQIVKTIADDAETGTDFDREGIREVRHLAAHEDISYVFVDEVDRIGRHAAETLFYLHEIREECGVTIITNEAGELDISDYADLVYVMMRALSSQSSNQTSTRRSIASLVQNFKDRDWFSVFNEVPLGYTETDDGWITKDPTEVGVVKEMFESFLNADLHRAYKETVEQSRGLPSDIQGAKLKRHLLRPVYVGKPTTKYVDRTRNDESKTETQVVDEDLRIITDETHERAVEKVQNIREKLTGDDDTDDINSLVEEFGPTTIVSISDIVQLRCPVCDERMRENGQRELGSRTVHNYECTADSCGRQRKFPTKDELNDL